MCYTTIQFCSDSDFVECHDRSVTNIVIPKVVVINSSGSKNRSLSQNFASDICLLSSWATRRIVEFETETQISVLA
jgi:hypothetical protein